MLIRIAIADSDMEYADRLAGVLETYDGVSLSVYTDEDSLKSALENEKLDVLLFAPDRSDCLKWLGASTLAVMFLADDQPVPESCGNVAKIRRYQRISAMFQQILELYAEVCSDAPEGVLGQAGVTELAFYSPAGGVGKTTAALVTAARLAEAGYRTLYLNMEDMAAEDFYLPQNGNKGLSDILSILDRDVNFSLKVQSLLQSKAENFYYLNHFTSPGDLEEMKAKELSALLSVLYH